MSVKRSLATALGGAWAVAAAAAGVPAHASLPRLTGIHNIRHIVVIMQENRSFDSYFGTYPGADGLPNACVPDPARQRCQRPFHDRADVNSGGPHSAQSDTADVDGGRMDGFIKEAEGARRRCLARNNPSCAATSSVDVMGYHDGRDIPNYWTYANQYVLQDHMFSSSASWSLPAHLSLVSEWSARCSVPLNPQSCRNDLPQTAGATQFVPGSAYAWPAVHYDWTDLTYLLHRARVSWRYYLDQGTEPDCADGAVTCSPAQQSTGVPGIWNPLPAFDTVHADNETANIVPARNLISDAGHDRLPAVSWVIPNDTHSEHPPSRVSVGQSYVTNIINAIMASRDWSSTAIFLTWDEWGGFYDHLRPPAIDANGYGVRVPGLVISPYARKGFIDHQILSSDAYAKFIEDDFLAGQRLDPRTDQRPDPRPNVREDAPQLGNLVDDFNFDQSPRPPLLLPESPQTDLTG